MSAKNTDIEVLRGAAVLLVVVHHAYGNLIPWRTPELTRIFSWFGGWVGVDLFFVISGFVIARSLLPNLDPGGDRERFWNTSIAFWIRRYWRLLPSAWLWIAIVLLCCLFFNESGAFGPFKTNFEFGLSAVLQVANFHLAGAYGTPGGSGALFHLWSLSLEEQFYLLLPLVILVSGRWLPHVLGAAILIQFASSRSGLYEMMLRTDGILLGVLLAMLAKTEVYRLLEPAFLGRFRLARIPLLLALFTSLAIMGAEGIEIVSHRVTMISLLGVILVFIASYDRDYIMRSGSLKNVFVWIGARSYGIYLIHIPVFCLTREIWYRIGRPASPDFNPAYWDQLVLTAIVLIGLLCELNYRLVEAPLRLKGREISRRLEARARKEPQPAQQR